MSGSPESRCVQQWWLQRPNTDRGLPTPHTHGGKKTKLKCLNAHVQCGPKKSWPQLLLGIRQLCLSDLAMHLGSLIGIQQKSTNNKSMQFEKQQFQLCHSLHILRNGGIWIKTHFFRKECTKFWLGHVCNGRRRDAGAEPGPPLRRSVGEDAAERPLGSRCV